MSLIFKVLKLFFKIFQGEDQGQKDGSGNPCSTPVTAASKAVSAVQDGIITPSAEVMCQNYQYLIQNYNETLNVDFKKGIILFTGKVFERESSLDGIDEGDEMQH